MNDTIALERALGQFCGSEQLYRHALNRRVLYSEGVQFFAENAGAGAYWLLDILATEPAILAEEFAHVTLKVVEGHANLVVTDGGKDGKSAKVVYRRDIDYTDCPLGTWELFFENMVIILPGEH
jgi:hypothetical protein